MPSERFKAKASATADCQPPVRPKTDRLRFEWRRPHTQLVCRAWVHRMDDRDRALQRGQLLVQLSTLAQLAVLYSYIREELWIGGDKFLQLLRSCPACVPFFQAIDAFVTNFMLSLASPCSSAPACARRLVVASAIFLLDVCAVAVLAPEVPTRIEAKPAAAAACLLTLKRRLLQLPSHLCVLVCNCRLSCLLVYCSSAAASLLPACRCAAAPEDDRRRFECSRGRCYRCPSSRSSFR